MEKNICEKCNKCFCSKYFLKVHKYNKCGRECYQCEKCGKKFKSKNYLDRHINKNICNLICENCKKKFSSRQMYIYHKNIYTLNQSLIFQHLIFYYL